MFLMSSNQVYSRYLYQMIMEFGSVSVRSLATFALQFTDAAFKNEKTLPTPENVVIQTDNKQSNTIEWNVNRKLTWNDF